MPDPDSIDGEAEGAIRTAAEIAGHLRDSGLDIVGGYAMRPLFESRGSEDWREFARSWDDLPSDGSMADGGTHRKRRFACVSVTGCALGLKPPRPHFPTRDNNPLNGGVDRIFAPVRDEVALDPVSRTITLTCIEIFTREAHPVTPERMARRKAPVPDRGAAERRGQTDARRPPSRRRRLVLATMVARTNVAGGLSIITDAGHGVLGEATLAEPFDALWLNDHRVSRGVSPIGPLDPERPARRDALVPTSRGDA